MRSATGPTLDDVANDAVAGPRSVGASCPQGVSGECPSRDERHQSRSLPYVDNSAAGQTVATRSGRVAYANAQASDAAAAVVRPARESGSDAFRSRVDGASRR